MTILLAALVLIALLFGVGAVIKGILWILFIVAALVAIAVYVAYRKFKTSI